MLRLTIFTSMIIIINIALADIDQPSVRLFSLVSPPQWMKILPLNSILDSLTFKRSIDMVLDLQLLRNSIPMIRISNIIGTEDTVRCHRKVHENYMIWVVHLHQYMLIYFQPMACIRKKTCTFRAVPKNVAWIVFKICWPVLCHPSPIQILFQLHGNQFLLASNHRIKIMYEIPPQDW